MPTYRVTDPQSGRTLRLTGDSPPTEQELEQIFGSVGAPSGERQFVGPTQEQAGIPRIDPSLSTPLGIAKGFGDVIVSSARGLVNRPAATLMGIKGALDPNDTYLAARDRYRQQIATDELAVKDDRLRTREGQALAQNIGTTLGYTGIPQALEFVGQKIEDVAGPEARDFAGSAAELASLGAPRAVAARASRTPVAAPQPSRADAIIAQGETHGVPVFLDDVTNSAVARRIGVAAEPLGPVGTGSGRARQAQAAQDAANRVTDSLLPSVGDDVPVQIQRGLQTKLNQFRQGAKRLYDRVSSELDPLGNMPTPGVQSIVRTKLQEEAARGSLANPQVVSLLEKYQQAPAGNFTAMRQMRSDIGDDISDFYTGANSAIGERGVGALQALKEALEKDMASFAQQSGKRGYDAWRAADGYYRANIVPFREAGFRDLVKTAEPEKAWRYLIAQGGLRSRAERMYRSLDESGRSSVRYGMVKEALDNATNPNGTFSPAKFAKYLEDHESVVNTFFKGSELKEIEGFRNLMRAVERAGQFAENPPTGQRLIPYLMGGAAVTGPLAAKAMGAAAVSGLTVRVLFQTKPGRNILLALGRAKPGSPASQRLVQRAQRLMATSAAAGAVGTASRESDLEAAQQ